ncbi:MAG: quinolinate synthase NadA [Dehalococcoidia bacterium]|nr:quinolinate synthase NadA [Dehalococcoidia bacterium]
MVVKVRQPTLPITELEQSAFCRTDDDLSTQPLEEELKAGVRWQKIPEDYYPLSAAQLDERIKAAREKLGRRLVILGHHYQRDEIIKYADLRGDSFNLAQYAAAHSESEYIVFCGVHFMAETADILSRPHQKVILPNMMAGCSMADMAPTEDVYDCWEELSELTTGHGGIVPLTYMNSTAAIKALCGRNNGLVCTSSNAAAAMRWAFERAQRVIFFPDEHLGRNTGLKLGLDLNDMVVWNPFKHLGGHTPERLRQAKLILWQGRCSVHTRFTVKQIQQARAKYTDVKVVVHPECLMETVKAADYNGSTEYIIKIVRDAPAGSKWAIGTEINLVNRVAHENPDKTVICLDPVVCPCATMYRIHPAYLAWALEGLVEGEVVNQVSVDEETSRDARVALERMLQLV